MKPILFSTPMVQAILAGRKTMTRRVVKTTAKNLYKGTGGLCGVFEDRPIGDKVDLIKLPYSVGDILWVRETWADVIEYPYFDQDGKTVTNIIYKASPETYEDGYSGKWRPSIFMPREACRIFLRVTDVRAERLQDISEEDAIKEGSYPAVWIEAMAKAGDPINPATYKNGFANLWNRLNANRGFGWDENPWVWVISFERCEKPEGV